MTITLEPVVQVLPKAALGDRLLERHIRRGDDARRRRCSERLPPTGRTSPSSRTRSRRTCKRGRRVADLVEQHRAAARLLEHAFVIGHGAR